MGHALSIGPSNRRSMHLVTRFHGKRADGTGNAQVLVHSKDALWPGSWHPTKNLLAYAATTPGNGEDVMVVGVDGDEGRGWTPAPPIPYVNTAASEREPVFSPDGRWVWYSSNESGRHEIYVRPFPGPGGRVTVSSAGGETPSWSRRRSELVFAAPASDYRRILWSHLIV